MDLLGESSSDSDFNIEDHYVNSESDSGDSNFTFTDDCGNPEEAKKDDEGDIICNNGNMTTDLSVMTSEEDDSIKVNIKEVIETIRICSICLGDASSDLNEIIDCDECGISVHEGCYGVQDSESVNSSVSSCSTEPWFCEACKAGVQNPTCELCPNFGGIFKETDCGKWVHLVCALYIPDICVGDVTSIIKLELFKHITPQRVNKRCTLCEDFRFSSTGVTIACDAGLCRTSFHVTCAQREGGLSDATSPDTDPTDPFYAHCKLHVDKLIVKTKKRNWEVLQSRIKHLKFKREQQSSEKSPSWQRNQQWLKKLQSKYDQMKKISKTPTTESTFESKFPRPITTSASSCSALLSKADLMGINTNSRETIEEQIKEVRDVPTKWFIPPAFSLEFVSYFTNRKLRLADFQKELKHTMEQKNILCDKLKIVQEKYKQDSKNNEILKRKHQELENMIEAYNYINSCSPNSNILDVDILTRKEVKNDHNSFINVAPLGLVNKCGICSHTNDQHLLAKCDTCCLYYHLRCLSPPLTRIPKKTKLCKWQCSKCESTNSYSDQQIVDPNAPKKSRCTRIEQSISDSHRTSSTVNDDFNDSLIQNEISGASKRKKQEQHNDKSKIKTKQVKYHKYQHTPHKDYSDLEPTDNHLANESPKHAIKIFIKSIPSPSGVKITSSQLLIGPQSDDTPKTFPTKPKTRVTAPIRIKKTSTDIKLTPLCYTCKKTGTTDIMVQCEDCKDYFHFSCLDPPVKKTPKVFGYSWHCEKCDPTDSDFSS